MDLITYQAHAVATDLHPGPEGRVISLLGLAGEAGELLTEYKKYLRDGSAHQLFTERVQEELGDLLWYIASVAAKFGLDLNEVAQSNIQKNQSRWGLRITGETSSPISYDEGFPETERLPRSFITTLAATLVGDTKRTQLSIYGIPFGNSLSDNAYDEDGYRFHDVLHLAFAAVLGWSPVVRKLLDVKRQSNKLIDEVEDGGRATAIEEGIAALVFTYAQAHSFYKGVKEVDLILLQTIKNLTAHLEVSSRTLGDWERSILSGLSVWREVNLYHSGEIEVDLDKRTIVFRPPLESTSRI